MPVKKKTTKTTSNIISKALNTPIVWSEDKKIVTIYGELNGQRLPSRILEEYIQQAVIEGARTLHIISRGQHGIGGRIWKNKGEPIKVVVEGPIGQRLGSMALPGTEIIALNSASDDVGWINCGAKITVLGDVTNGAFNAAAQGILYVQGSGGARCDTMTKHNPRFDPPQSWYFRNVGDSFAEFKAGGIAVVCGVNPRNPYNVLGYRPCVGMVGGIIYFRGPVQDYSEKDVKLLELSEQDWQWLVINMRPYLEAIDRINFYEELTKSPSEWKKLVAYTPQEKRGRKVFKISTAEFRKNTWEKEIGQGGMFAEYLDHEQSILPYVTTGKDRRYKPVWANEKYAPPCAYTCPTKIPSHKRAALIRQGRLQEAIELVLQYSPLPSSVCGEICPNLCMQSCTRSKIDSPLDIDKLGKTALETPAPAKAESTNYKIAVIGGGPAGMSAAWQLALKGHNVTIFEATHSLGGKLELCIPKERLPQEVLQKELERFAQLGVDVRLNTKVDKDLFMQIYKDYDIIVIACGAHEPRKIPFQGHEHTISAYDYLRRINEGRPFDVKGKKVVIIGAGNVGMDVASEAYNHGAQSVIAIDIQKPAAFGKEMEIARSKGTEIIWPKFTDRYDYETKQIYFKDGTSLQADVLIMSIGDMPKLDFLPPSIHTERGWVVANTNYQTSDPKVYAVGDVTGLGLVTHAIGNARIAAQHIHHHLMKLPYLPEQKEVISYERIKTEYYEACKTPFTAESTAQRCMSCGLCRDCHMCETTCYHGAISRLETATGGFEYVVDESKCIACGFCAGICPCGVWEMHENI